MTTAVASHIELRETNLGAKAFVAGSRISVEDIYIEHELLGRTPDEIVAAHPQLALFQVHSALAYYHENASQIQSQLEAARDFSNRMQEKFGPGPLARKMSNGLAD